MQAMLELAAENAVHWRKIYFNMNLAECLEAFYSVLDLKAYPAS